MEADAPKPAIPAEPTTSALALPDKPSIAVLPFQNMSGDPEQEYFTDGITEDIITELSRFHSLFVIARNSSFSYKGKSPDIRQVGRELGVRYVLEGSIRKSSNRIRVTGQLIDTLTGNHIWAERYDRVLEDIFAVQEEVTQAIVAAIAPQIEATEQSKAARRRPDNLSAYEIALLAWAHAWEGQRQGGSNDFSIRRFARQEKRWRSTRGACWHCIQLPLLAANVRIHSVGWWIGSMPFGKPCWRPRVRSNWTVRMRLATRCEGLCVLLSGQFDRYPEALADAQRAHEMNPNDVFVLRFSALEAGSRSSTSGPSNTVIRSCG